MGLKVNTISKTKMKTLDPNGGQWKMATCYGDLCSRWGRIRWWEVVEQVREMEN